MNYPVVIHKDKNSDYGVTVPGLPGCFSAGSTIDEAVAMAREAIELHLEGLIEDGQPVPEPGRIEDYRTRRAYRGGTWAVVPIDPADLRVKAKRVNITMPERILGAVDRFAEAENETRSGLLVKAATEYMARASSRSERSRSRSRRGGARRRGR